MSLSITKHQKYELLTVKYCQKLKVSKQKHFVLEKFNFV